MVLKALHAVVAHPWVYDQVQMLAGAAQVQRRLAPYIQLLQPSYVVIDIGAGTGLVRKVCHPKISYICLDIDRLKIQGFLGKYPKGVAIIADATNTPVLESSVDAVVCTFVTHHLTNDQMADLLAESVRVLKPGGTFIYIDPIWQPDRIAGRILWSLDRGSYPHTADHIHSAISQKFDVLYKEQFAVYHEYVIYVGQK